MELERSDAAESRRDIERLEMEDASIQSVYELLRNKCAPRKLVDKSPSYASDLATLQRAEMMFEGAKYIHLIRHPYSAIESFARMRFDKLLGATNLDPYRLGERVWAQSNANILRFLDNVNDDRKLSVVYEQLVHHPGQIMRRICEFLDLPFDPATLRPYEGARMTEGVSKVSAPIGDPNFRNHCEIEERLADAWSAIRLPLRVSLETSTLARSWGYELPHDCAVEPSRSRMEEEIMDVRGLATCVCAWGPCDAPIVLVVHGILDHGAAWGVVAQQLAARGYRVMAPDLRGHGRSAHASPAASYNFLDLLADLDAIGSKLAAPFTLVGHSLGAAIAAAYTAVRPDRVRSLILVEPPLPPSEDRRPINGLRVHLDALSDCTPHPVFPNDTAASEAIRRAHPRITSEQAQVMAARLTETCRGGVRWRWDARLRTRAGVGYSGTGGIARGSFVEMIRSISAPMTLIYGNSSELLRRSDVDGFVEAASGARAIWLDGGHNLHHDAADAVALVIDEHAFGLPREESVSPVVANDVTTIQ
jgi:pimeloyl-ACP methyl ester carboxylesterase